MTSLLDTLAGVRLTYADADFRSAQLARVLASFGVRRGDRVAVQVEKSPEAVLLYLACLRYGAALVPMNTAYSADEVAYLLDDAEPALFVDDRRLGELGRAADEQPPTFDDVERSPHVGSRRLHVRERRSTLRVARIDQHRKARVPLQQLM